MAGWVNSTGAIAGAGAGNGNSRGAGGRGFTNRRHTSDAVHGGSSSGSGGGSGRWRGERSRGRPPPQAHYRYRPVDAAHRHSPPSTGPALSHQAASSTSTRHAQINHPSATDKSSASETVAPAGSNKETDDKANRNAANFECNVCFDMAAEPVVTKCGHLFCWECLYQWLHVHSDHRECPVCKGQVAEDAIIPIYGCGGSAASVDNAPPRPTGARVESSRQQHQQQHHLHTPHRMVYADDDEEDDPFDFPSMMNFGFGATSVRDAVRSFMSPSFDDVEMEDQFDDYTYEYNTGEHFEEVYDYNLLGFPVFAPAGTGAAVANPSSSRSHPQFEYVDIDSIIPSHNREFGYSGAAPHNQNRGRHGRRHRARASADQSSTDAMVTGGSGAFYRDNSASSNVSAGASSQPNGSWAERRGRSNRNSNSAGGRGVQDGRRHRTGYS